VLSNAAHQITPAIRSKSRFEFTDAPRQSLIRARRQNPGRSLIWDDTTHGADDHRKGSRPIRRPSQIPSLDVPFDFAAQAARELLQPS
jgi:hypothetical protein